MSAGAGRGNVERWLVDYWTGDASRAGSAVLTLLTSPVSVLFSSGVRLRNYAFDRGFLRSEPPPIPTISVGNLTVGGTGKTPMTRWLVSLLVAEGERPAVVSRGFGEDELLLHRRWHPNVPVIEAPRRVEGVRAAAAQGCSVAVVDDGFQHRAMERSLDLVLLSPSQPPPVRLLPRGPYREPLRSLRRAHGVFVTAKNLEERDRASELLDEVRSISGIPPAYLLSFLPGPWSTLSGESAPTPSGPLLVVTSVAQPRGFVELIRERGPGEAADRVELMAYPDHHPYTPADLEDIAKKADGRIVVTTEKDAVKLLPLLAERAEGDRSVHSGSAGPDPSAAVGGSDGGGESSVPEFRVLPLEVAPADRVEGALLALIRPVLASPVPPSGVGGRPMDSTPSSAPDRSPRGGEA